MRLQPMDANRAKIKLLNGRGSEMFTQNADTLNIFLDCKIAIDWEAYCNGMGVLMPNGEVLKYEPWTSDEKERS